VTGALAGKVAVVTGASRGIGRAIATHFADAGARVALLARSAEALAVASTDIARRGGSAIAVRCDVSQSAEVAAAAAEVRAALGAVDIVVNNAGSVLRKPALDIDDAEWRRVLAVNLDGTFFVTRAFGPDLVARGGRIINVASIAGRQGTPLLTAYCAAKHAVVGFTRALAEELRGAKVAVNAICPGSVDTEMLREGLPGVAPDMTPDDIARTALFLAAEAPQALTGACIDVFG
jgi:NAD(P)-dependent dehydrogenase (short-subunit alcohol dehydrogenase family)